MSWRFWKWPLAWQIMAGLVLGIGLGLVVEARFGADHPGVAWWIANVTRPVGSLFMRLIFMVVIPLVVSALIVGVLELGDVRHLGRVGLRCLGITLFLAGAAVAIGIALVNLLQPGARIDAETREALQAAHRTQTVTAVTQGTQKMPLGERLLTIIPQNPLAEAVDAFTPGHAGGGLFAVMVFSLIFGVALGMCERERVRSLVGFFEGLFEASLKIIGMAMRLAPAGVACLTFNSAALMGVELLGTLGAYVGTVVLGLALHQFVTYPVALKWLAGTSPAAFFRATQEAIVTAFSTSSSSATLPTSLRVAEENLRLPPAISRFVLTVGSSANQNGTALYEGITVLFLAQLFGIDLTLGQQITVALLCIMAGVGTAGVPGGSLPLVVGVLVTVGVPAEAIAVIYGVDRFLDMCRTTLNVTGDLVCAVWVARGET